MKFFFIHCPISRGVACPIRDAFSRIRRLAIYPFIEKKNLCPDRHKFFRLFGRRTIIASSKEDPKAKDEQKNKQDD